MLFLCVCVCVCVCVCMHDMNCMIHFSLNSGVSSKFWGVFCFVLLGVRQDLSDLKVSPGWP
jgi:hypothetical protein